MIIMIIMINIMITNMMMMLLIEMMMVMDLPDDHDDNVDHDECGVPFPLQSDPSSSSSSFFLLQNHQRHPPSKKGRGMLSKMLITKLLLLQGIGRGGVQLLNIGRRGFNFYKLISKHSKGVKTHLHLSCC